jgi:hypothetical protein
MPSKFGHWMNSISTRSILCGATVFICSICCGPGVLYSLYMIPVFGASHLGKSHRCNILAGKVFMVNWWWYLITSCCNVYSLHSVDFPTDDCVTICDLNQNYCSETLLFLSNHVETMETSILDTWTAPKKVCFAFVWFYFSYVIYMLHLCSVLTRCSTSSSVRSHCMPSRSVSLGPRFRQRFWSLGS